MRMIEEKRAANKLYWMCWLVYAGSYFGRYNLSAAIAAIVAEGLFSKAQMGAIGTVFFIVYGTGQLINGFLGDRFSPLKMIFCGTIVSSFANIAMSFATTMPAMCVIWGINGFAQSMLWSPIIYIISNVLDPSKRKWASTRIASTIPVGTISAYLSSTILMRFFNWKSVFVIAGIVLFAISLLWLATAIKVNPTLQLGHKAAATKKKEQTERKKLLPLLTASGVLIMAFPIMLHSMLKDGVMTWVPTMISEVYHMSPSFSTLLTIVLPIINLGGALLACRFCYNKGISEVKSALIFFCFVMLPVVALLLIGRLPSLVSTLLLALITMSMFGVNSIFLTLVPVSFAKHGRASTMAGLIDSIAYLGSAISSYGFGRLSESFGWEKTIISWVVIAALALVCCALCAKRWENFKKA